MRGKQSHTRHVYSKQTFTKSRGCLCYRAFCVEMWCIGRLTVTEGGESSLRIRKKEMSPQRMNNSLSLCWHPVKSASLHQGQKVWRQQPELKIERWFRLCGPEEEKVWGEMVRTRSICTSCPAHTFLHRRAMRSLDIIFHLSPASGRCPACPFRLVLSSVCKYKCSVWKWPHFDRPLLGRFRQN